MNIQHRSAISSHISFFQLSNKYTTMILENRQLLSMRGSKVVAACIFNKLRAVGMFLFLDGTSGKIIRVYFFSQQQLPVYSN